MEMEDMWKLCSILFSICAVLFLAAIFFARTDKNDVNYTKELPYELVVIEIDSCEYITTKSNVQRDLLTHKGNCKYCEERRRKEQE